MMTLHPTKDVMKSGNFSLAKPQRTQSQEMASFSTKTGKNLAVMQGLALCFFPLPTCSEASFGKPVTEKKQPSCLRLAIASKTGKTADAKTLAALRQ